MRKIFGVSRVWLTLTVITGIVVAVYLALSLSVSADPLLMPLDDTYIHFQYARQMAEGRPFVYNEGDPATSGGTSLIYPPLLAFGYLLGFTGWALAYWALALGIVFFAGSTWLVYLIGSANPLKPDQPNQAQYAFWLAVAFAFCGPAIWAALSGMETALFVFLVLLTLYAIQRARFRLAIVVATLMTLTRPEGVILAGITAGLWPYTRRRQLIWLSIPVLVGLIQPAINFLATGSASSSGMVAKSHLYNTGAPFDERIVAILDSFVRLWRELFTGHSPDFGTFTPWIMVQAAVVALAFGAVLAWRTRRINAALVMLIWVLALTAAVSTLDTAFWQFKRYQLPVMALFFPAAAWGVALIGERFAEAAGMRWRWIRWALPVIIVIGSGLTAITFARNYRNNVQVVRDQQVKMAQWVRDNLPEDARVGVHDVGLVRYFGDRVLYDVVGLTTPGPAEAWRQGPGAIYEHMASSEYRPDFFAIYPDVQGLRYLLDAGVFGSILAEFPIKMPEHNVAAATDYQAVYVADWSNTRDQEIIAQDSTLNYLAQLEGATLVDEIDVANLESEADHDYTWWQDDQPEGFVTEVYRNVYHACGLEYGPDCWATDGGRVLTGGEEFTIKTIPGQDLLLVTRVHGRASVPIRVLVNDYHYVLRVQPELPGRWVEIVTLVPGYTIKEETLIRIEPHTDPEVYSDGYMPYYHWAYQGKFEFQEVDQEPIANFHGQGLIELLGQQVNQHANSIDIQLTLAGGETALPRADSNMPPDPGDGVVFVHLYNEGKLNEDPMAQVVSRPGGGALPPGNWLPGIIEDSYTLPLPEDLPPGTYIIAIGMFDARTGERYGISSSDMTVDDNRLFIGEIIIGKESNP